MAQCIDELRELVEENLAFLKEKGFRITYSEERRGGVECLVIVATDHYKVRVTSEMGYINLFVGPLDAPDGFADTGWYYLGGVLDYLEMRHRSLEEILAFDQEMDALTAREVMRYWAKRMQEKEEQIASIFGRPDEIKIREMERYFDLARVSVAKELRARYGKDD
jgi:hypothetical protein